MCGVDTITLECLGTDLVFADGGGDRCSLSHYGILFGIRNSSERHEIILGRLGTVAGGVVWRVLCF